MTTTLIQSQEFSLDFTAPDTLNFEPDTALAAGSFVMLVVEVSSAEDGFFSNPLIPTTVLPPPSEDAYIFRGWNSVSAMSENRRSVQVFFATTESIVDFNFDSNEEMTGDFTVKAVLTEIASDLGRFIPFVIPSYQAAIENPSTYAGVSPGVYSGYDKDGILIAVGITPSGACPNINGIAGQADTAFEGRFRVEWDEAPLTPTAISITVDSTPEQTVLVGLGIIVEQSRYTTERQQRASSSSMTLSAKPVTGRLMLLSVRSTAAVGTLSGWTKIAKVGDSGLVSTLFWKEAGSDESQAISVAGATHLEYLEASGFSRRPMLLKSVKMDRNLDPTGHDEDIDWQEENAGRTRMVELPSNDGYFFATIAFGTQQSLAGVLPDPYAHVNRSLVTAGDGWDFYPDIPLIPVQIMGVGADDIEPPMDQVGIGAIFADDPDAPGPTGPDADSDAYEAQFETALTVSASNGLLANDEGTEIEVTSSTEPSHGEVTVEANGAFTYTPEEGFSGTDSFTYTITDNEGGSDSATVVITVAEQDGSTIPYSFPEPGQSLAFTPGPRRGSALTSSRGVEFYVYADADGEELAEITTPEGDPIEGSIITVGADSLIPRFLGPAGTTRLWIKRAGDTTVLPLDASFAQQIDSGAGGGGGNGGGEEDTRPINLLPAALAYHTPWSMWKSNGSRSPGVFQASEFSLAVMPWFDGSASPDTPGWFGAWENNSVALLRFDGGEDFMFTMRGFFIDLAGQWSGPTPVVRIGLGWYPIVDGIVQSFGLPISSDPFDLELEFREGALTGFSIEDFQALPLIGHSVTFPDYDGDGPLDGWMLAGIVISYTDGLDGDPLSGEGTPSIALASTGFHLYRGTEVEESRPGETMQSIVGGMSSVRSLSMLHSEANPLFGDNGFMSLGVGGLTFGWYESGSSAVEASTALVPERSGDQRWLRATRVKSSFEPVEDDDLVPKSYADDQAAETLSLTVPVQKYGNGPEVGGKWLVVGEDFGRYETPDVGPMDGDGFKLRARVVGLHPDPARVGELLSFMEFLTQYRQEPGEWGADQDNFEAALVIFHDAVGVFSEHCLIGTPTETQGGEYANGRMYSLPESDFQNLYAFRDLRFRLALGEPIELLYTYIFDNEASGRWRQEWMYRTNADNYDTTQDNDTTFWKSLMVKVGSEEDGPGSIADAGMPWVSGYNPGAWGVEFIQAWKIHTGDADELVLDLQSKDRQSDGTVASALIPGQVWTPEGTPGYLDTTPSGLIAAAQVIPQRLGCRIVNNDLDVVDGTFTDIDLQDPDGNSLTTISRSGRAGLAMLLIGGDNSGLWYCTESGPCIRASKQPGAGDMIWADAPSNWDESFLLTQRVNDQGWYTVFPAPHQFLWINRPAP